MTSTSWVGRASINGGPPAPFQLMVERQVEMVTSISPKADPKWTFTDAAGHFHAYDQTPDAYSRYPTLRIRVEEVPCSHADHDEDCDGANIIHYHCRICDEEITPGLIPGPHSEPLYGRYEWSAKVTVSADEWFALSGEGFAGQPVSVRAEFSSHEAFGIARIGAVNGSTDRLTVDLIGDGPLGRTQARMAVPA